MAAAVSFLVIFSFFHSVLPHGIEQFKSCLPSYCGNSTESNSGFHNVGPPRDCEPFWVGSCAKELYGNTLIRARKKLYDYNSLQYIPLNLVSQSNEFQRQLNSSLCRSSNKLGRHILQDVASSIVSILTLFNCGLFAHYSEDAHASCQNVSFYQIVEKETFPSPPPHCSLVPLNVNDYCNEIFELLAVRVTFGVIECDKCLAEGHDCELQCQGPPRSNKKNIGLKLELALGLGGAAIMMVAFLLYLYRRILIPARASVIPSSSDVERSNVFFGVPIFIHSELEEATNNFDSKNELGGGGFGTVYYGKLRDRREIAVKRLYEPNYKSVEQFMNEIEILTRLRHKNLVPLYGCTSRHSRELLLVYEYIPNGTVADHLHGHRAQSAPLIWPIRMQIAIETASALAYLHASGIIHRDVKTNNILLDNNFCVKVADFGLSRLFPNDVTHVSTLPQGTPGYIDPEYFQCFQLTDKSDVYSFGVVLIELISSMRPVDITRHEINLALLAINRIQKCALDELIDSCLGYGSDDVVKTMTTLVAQLAFRCLQQDKELRPSMDEVLQGLKIIESTEYKSEDH